MYNKGRRPWKRGKKMRYSLYKAIDRQDGEESYKEWAKDFADAKDYDIALFYPEDNDAKHFWERTYEALVAYNYQRRYDKLMAECSENLEDVLKMLKDCDSSYWNKHLNINKKQVREIIKGLEEIHSRVV